MVGPDRDAVNLKPAVPETFPGRAHLPSDGGVPGPGPRPPGRAGPAGHGACGHHHDDHNDISKLDTIYSTYENKHLLRILTLLINYL